MVDYPKPNQEQRSNGWLIDPAFVERVRRRFVLIAPEDRCPDVADIETILIALNDVLWKSQHETDTVPL